MEAHLQHFTRLQEALRIERDEERERFRKQFIETPLNERKQKGISWYPVDVEGEEISLGGKTVLSLSRAAGPAPINLFSSGAIAMLFSMAEPSRKVPPSISAVVVFCDGHKMKLALEDEEVPDWIEEGKLGVDLSYDERAFREMDKSLKRVLDATKGRVKELRDIFGQQSPPKFLPRCAPINVGNLNLSQQAAVQQMVLAEDLSLVHGPPGTGKTTTLIQGVLALLRDNNQILVCAPSNLAVDLLTEKLDAEGVPVVRIGHPARLSEGVLRHSLDVMIQTHPGHEVMREYRKEAEKAKKHAHKFKRNFGREEREGKKALLTEAKELLAQARKLENFILTDVLDKAKVIACTLVGAASEILSKRRFPVLVIDEAAQALEPSCWIPIEKADKVILAGDHCQLPPTIKSSKAENAGLGQTLFARLMAAFPEAATMLDTQYRMNESIMNFSSRQFYENKLIAAPKVAQWTLAGEVGLTTEPFTFIDTAGCGFSEKQNPESLSLKNEEEANLLLRVLHLIVQGIEKSQEKSFSIGIISPYKEQVYTLKNALKNYQALWPWSKQISVDTVDGFQGQERDMICISLVRSNANGAIGFLNDTRRMNVAMTRARKKLLIVGDSATIANSPFYNQLLDYIDEVNAYHTAWEFPDDN